MDESSRDSPALHALKNHLAVIIGFSELLLSDLPETDRKRKDVLEIHQAANAALAVVKSGLKYP